jgi:hypothetical protein
MARRHQRPKEIRIMKLVIAAVAAASLLVVAPAFAQSTTAPKTKAPAAKTAPAPKPAAAPVIHATKGVVKSVDDSTLVITKTAGKGPATTFMLNASTDRQGTIADGSTVDVRYHADGKNKVATAVTVQEAKVPAASKPKAKK